MANFKFDARMGDTWLEDVYDADSLEVLSTSSKLVVYVDDSGAKIQAVGTGLTVDADGALKSGVVTGIVFLNATGGTLLSVSNASFSAAKLYATFDTRGSLFDLMTFVSAGKDVYTGSESGEQITIGDNAGDDTINALGGDDFVLGSAGKDTMDGGKGFDTLSYQDTVYDKTNAKTGIVLNVVAGTVKDSWGATDKIKNFEAYRGSYLADTMTGSNLDEGFSGLGGNDVIDGKGGFDTLRYNRDERFGGEKGIVADLSKGTVIDGFGNTDKVKNIEEVHGTRFADKFTGNGADNTFRGLAGKDSFDGAAGYDVVDFRTGSDSGSKGIVVDMTRSSLQVRNDGFGNIETLASIERVFGSNLNDKITLGVAAMDASGGHGKDTLIAGQGENWLSGNEGADTFVFLTTSASKAGTTTRDFIEDFSKSEGDHIDLASLGHLTFTGLAGHKVGTATVAYFVNTNGDTVVGADTNKDGKADLQFVMDGSIKLVATDFILS